MNNRNQPIYDNSELKKAGKYNFENVNDINRRSGEMQYDSTIVYKEKPKKNKKPVIVASIVSGVFIIFVCLIAFTDLKYLFFPKKEKVIVDDNFEDLNIMHELVCTGSSINSGLKMYVTRKYIYNNNKVKKVVYEFNIDISQEQMVADQSLTDYMVSSFTQLVESYKKIDAVEATYKKEGNNYYYSQEMDLEKLSKYDNAKSLTDITYDQSISVAELTAKRQNLTCESKKK